MPDPPVWDMDSVHPVEFPPFITPIEDYFDLRFKIISPIDSASYRLEISGAVLDSVKLSLEDLSKLRMHEKTLTIECIENPPNGELLATAKWRGFRLYDLLDSLGIPELASTVRYTCADGYYTYNTLEEVKNSEVLCALYINDEPIPPKYGFPLRVLFPGYYGVRQPGWVVKIELLGSGPEDFWAQYGWETDSAMAIDSKIFFPGEGETFTLGDTIKVGGAAYGPRRISSVDVTIDGGKTWVPAEIIQDTDQDFVWVFWEASIVPQFTGRRNIYASAISVDGNIQPLSDTDFLDGTNAWSSVQILVRENN